MKSIAIARATALATLVAFGAAGVAEARNPHCAGGIQYVVQAMKDKDRGNMEDYEREISKAVQQLEICQTEDPADFEAVAYLGWAYAEADSMCLAGKAFATAIAGLEKKGDKKKVEWATNNQTSYWARTYNEGISRIQTAQGFYPDFCKVPENDADKAAKAEAEKNYREAAANLKRAMCLKPSDPSSVRNLASVHALTCDFPKAEALLHEGLKTSPADTNLQTALKMVRVNYANQLTNEKKYDEAIAYYGQLTQAEPNNADLWLGMADAIFRRAQSGTGGPEARKKDFCSAGDAYAKAFTLSPNDADLSFNSGVAYQNCQTWDRAEAMWAKTVQVRGDDTDALSSWGMCLVELKRCPEAITAVHKAVTLKPQDRNLHRQLGAVYTRCGNNTRGTDELMIYLAMANGQPAADAASLAKEAKQGTDAAKTLASQGVPDQIIQWEADNQKFDTWFYWSKKVAFAFSAGTLTRKSDWSTPDVKPAGK